MSEKDEILDGLPEENDLQNFDLDEIMKEFGGGENPEEPTDPMPETETDEPDPEQLLQPDIPETPAAEPVGEPEEQQPAQTPEITGDTVRLDHLADALKEMVEGRLSASETPPAEEEPNPEPFSAEWEPEYEQPMGDYIPPEPIIFRPKSRLRELKRKLIAGPEKRYYELSEQGLGKLQVTIFLNVLVVLLAVGSTVLYGLNLVQENRMKLLIFVQVLVMLMAGLLGSYRMLEGAGDLLRKRFTLNTLLLITFMACCADGVFCLIEQKVPCCAAFSLEMLMCQWGTYQKRVTEMGQMDTLRKATQLDGVVATPDYYEGRPGFLRREAQVEEFMDHYRETSGPEKTLQIYSLIALVMAIAIGVVAGVLHSVVLGVRAFAAALLAAVPVTAFITLSRPMAILERRLHKLGTVICGWQGVKAMSVTAAYPLGDLDLFPAGSTKMNGVKFFGKRDPDEIVAYATALISADGGGLAPLFNHLLESRNGYHYEVENLQCYGNGGIGGEVCGEPVLVGIQPFLQDMGVEMPEGTRVSQAVYVAIDGQLCGVFAITYSKSKSSAAGMATLCSYRGLNPVLVTGDFMLTESFLRSKFGVNTRRMAFPPRADRAALAAREADPDITSAALTTKDGLAPAAYAVTGARALKSASMIGTLIHLIGGALGLAMMLTLAILGAEELLTPVNLLLYELLWMIPGFLITEWTRSI